MSNEIYFKNVDDGEYIVLEGNSNYSEWEQEENTLYLMWIMLNKWVGKNVKCMTFNQQDYQDMVNLKDVSDKLGNEFVKEKEKEILRLHRKNDCFQDLQTLFYNLQKEKEEK